MTREEPAKYIIVLENSHAMNFNNSTWQLLRSALRKFIKEDLDDPESQVGLVLFNEAAYVRNKMVRIDEKHSRSRSDLSINIPNKFSLSHKQDSCIRCGITQAIQALEVKKNYQIFESLVALFQQD